MIIVNSSSNKESAMSRVTKIAATVALSGLPALSPPESATKRSERSVASDALRVLRALCSPAVDDQPYSLNP